MKRRQPLSPGTLVGSRYRVEKLLGQGQFWLTYVAGDEAGDNLVVLKEYLPAGVGGRETGSEVSVLDEDLFDWGRARFIEEAARLGELNIDGLATSFDIVRQNSTAYLVREHVVGQSLLEWADQLGRRPYQSELDAIAERLTTALGALHKSGLLHRDITPDHILLREGREAVLVDCGGARTAFAARARRMHTYVRPGYSPPEQYLFEEAAQGPFTDVFGLGASLYRAVTARGPTDVIARNLKDDMPKAQNALGRTFRPVFLQAIDAAMSLAPDARPQTIAEFALHLLAVPQQDAKSVARAGSAASTDARSAPSRPRVVTKPAKLSPRMGWAEKALSPATIAVSALSLATIAAILFAAARRTPPITLDIPPNAAPQATLRTEPAPPPKASPTVQPIPPPRPLPADEIAAATDRDALLQLLRTYPAQRDAVAKRLRALGYVEIRLAQDSLWTKPGTGEGFRDCASCPELVAAPSGEFLMGSPRDEAGRGEDEDDTPGPGGSQVRVAFAAPFGIGRFEVTRGEFAEFVRASGYRMEPGCYARLDSWKLVEDLTWRATGYAQDDRHPVACVSLHDAEAYARWLSARTGRAYRLPTEAEWEYAARGVRVAVPQPPYPFGADPRELCAFGNGADIATKADNPGWQVAPCNDGYVATAPVGRFTPNAFGLHDMLGNLWEWTSDCWRDRLAPDPLAAPGCADDAPRVLKGGSFSDPPRMLRPATRIASSPTVRDQIAGFRVIREIPP